MTKTTGAGAATTAAAAAADQNNRRHPINPGASALLDQNPLPPPSTNIGLTKTSGTARTEQSAIPATITASRLQRKDLKPSAAKRSLASLSTLDSLSLGTGQLGTGTGAAAHSLQSQSLQDRLDEVARRRAARILSAAGG